MVIIGILLFMSVVMQFVSACITLAIFGMLQKKAEMECR